MVKQTQAAKVYTPDVIKMITERYKSEPTQDTVKALAKELGVSDRSVIAKLSSLEIYIKKSYVTKQGTAPISKEVYIQKIAGMLGMDITLMDSMEKVTKQVLVTMEARIRDLAELD